MGQMRGESVVGILLVAILVSAGAGYLSGSSNERVVSSLSTTTIAPVTNFSTTTVTSTISTASGSQASQQQVCISNINSPPQAQYVADLGQMIKMQSFIQYSNGRCWTWDSTFVASGPGYSRATFVFEHFSNQIYYPCFYAPAYRIDAELFVVPTFTNGNVTGISIEPQSPPDGGSCPAMTPNIVPISFNLVNWTAAGQTVSLELKFLFGNNSMQSLDALIHTSTWSYDIQFPWVNATRPLAPGVEVTQSVYLPGSPFQAGVVYDVTASGTYVNGTRTASNFQIELQT